MNKVSNGVKQKTAFIFFPFLFAFSGFHWGHFDFFDHAQYHFQNFQHQTASYTQDSDNGNDDIAGDNSMDTPSGDSDGAAAGDATDTSLSTIDSPSTIADIAAPASDTPPVFTLPIGPDIASSAQSAPEATDIFTPMVPDTGSPGTDTPATENASDTVVDGLNTQTTTTAGMTASSTPPPQSSNSGNIFSTGGVTFRFDDGWSSQLDAAKPLLDAAGIKGTFYIITHQLGDQGFSGFMTSADVQSLAASGEDVGAHTQTHPHLPTLSTSRQSQEIAGSKSDLEALGITPSTFSYPYGEYTSDTLQIVKDAGFSSAVTTVETPVSPTSDRFQIESPSLTLSQSPEEIEQMIQNAVANHQWLIMTFHRIDNSGDAYSMTPASFQQIVDYVQSNSIPTVTVSQGAAELP